MKNTKPKAEKPKDIYTVGHSTHTSKEFVELLRAHGIRRVVDIRTIPKSRHNPQFNEARLATTLRKNRVAYVHEPLLGGLRRTKKDSVNLGWRNASFRGFADYMQTDNFEKGLAKLMALASHSKTAIMCAEAVPWRCHRSLVADALKKKGVRVFHIMSAKNMHEHRYTPFLRVRKGKLVYPISKEVTT
jgi:uncharacterized protein (DUF488 family)